MDKTAGSIVFVMDIKLYLMQKNAVRSSKTTLMNGEYFYFPLLTSMDYLNLMIWTIIVQKNNPPVGGLFDYVC